MDLVRVSTMQLHLANALEAEPINSQHAAVAVRAQACAMMATMVPDWIERIEDAALRAQMRQMAAEAIAEAERMFESSRIGGAQ